MSRLNPRAGMDDVLIACATEMNTDADITAYAKALSRCWPSVTPGLAPTGTAGVGSLKPTPGALPLTIVIVAAASAAAETLASTTTAAVTRHSDRSLFVMMGLRRGRYGLTQPGVCL